MRRLRIAAPAAAVVLALAGCGSSSRSGAANPTLDALSYFPSATPFVATVATDPNARALQQAQALQQSFPAAALGETALIAQLGRLGIDYNRDVRPLFGNPVAVGVLGTGVAGPHTPALVAWHTRDAKQLATLVKKLSGLQKAGAHGGATLYTTQSLALAIDGPTLLVSRSAQDIKQALDRHAHQQGFSATQYDRDTAGIPQTGVAQMMGSLTGALSTPGARNARQVPWVAAIRGYGAAVTATRASLGIRFHVDTSGRTLTSADLPLAAGAAAPGLAGILPILVGIRDPAQIWSFGVDAVRAAQPSSYAKLRTHEAKIRRRTGVDVESLIAKLTGDLDVTSDAHTTAARIQVSDPAAVSSMIARLMRDPTAGGALLRRGTTARPLGHGLYRLHGASSTLTLGVVGDHLLLGRATPAELRSYASTPSVGAAGASGAMSFKLALTDLLRLTLKRPPPPAVQQLLNQLGDVTGSVRSTAQGMFGTMSLSLR